MLRTAAGIGRVSSAWRWRGSEGRGMSRGIAQRAWRQHAGMLTLSQPPTVASVPRGCGGGSAAFMPVATRDQELVPLNRGRRLAVAAHRGPPPARPGSFPAADRRRAAAGTHGRSRSYLSFPPRQQRLPGRCPRKRGAAPTPGRSSLLTRPPSSAGLHQIRVRLADVAPIARHHGRNSAVARGRQRSSVIGIVGLKENFRNGPFRLRASHTATISRSDTLSAINGFLSRSISKILQHMLP